MKCRLLELTTETKSAEQVTSRMTFDSLLLKRLTWPVNRSFYADLLPHACIVKGQSISVSNSVYKLN